MDFRSVLKTPKVLKTPNIMYALHGLFQVSTSMYFYSFEETRTVNLNKT